MKKESKYKYRGKLLKVEEAPEPSDVYWTNAGLPWKEKLARRTKTNVALVFIMAGIFAIISGIN